MQISSGSIVMSRDLRRHSPAAHVGVQPLDVVETEWKTRLLDDTAATTAGRRGRRQARRAWARSESG